MTNGSVLSIHRPTWLVQEGVDLNKVRELLGHRSFVMVLRYSHLQPEHLREAVESKPPTSP
jgi:site-specific recombinase XerD